MASVLVVDDEPVVCSMLEAVLARDGHDVMTAADGVQAIDVVQTHDIDVAVVDIIMPEKDGLEVLWQVQRIAPDIKIIAISGGSRIKQADFLSMAKRLGAIEAYAKPLDNELLLQTIRRIEVERNS